MKESPDLRVSDISNTGNFVRLIELFPPSLPVPELASDSQRFDLSLRFERLLNSINSLESLADGFCLPELKDGQRIHLNSVGLASELTRKTGAAIIPTLTLRDSNRQNILGTIAYALFAGIENLLIVRGDPYRDGEGNTAKNVYEIKSVAAAVSSIRRLESHLSNQDRLCIISPINLSRASDPKYLEAIKSREFAGVDLFLAESLFEDLETYFARVEAVRKAGAKLPIVHTIFPLRGYEDAINCIQKFGWQIPDDELHVLKSKGSEYGLEMARRRYQGLLSRKDSAQGACISTRGDPEIARLITL